MEVGFNCRKNTLIIWPFFGIKSNANKKKGTVLILDHVTLGLNELKKS